LKFEKEFFRDATGSFREENAGSRNRPAGCSLMFVGRFAAAVAMSGASCQAVLHGCLPAEKFWLRQNFIVQG
jgi:hypothetical protein